MKKLWIPVALSLLLLTGCGSRQTFETVADSHDVPAAAVTYTLQLQLPEEAAQTAMGAQGQTLYCCDGYTLAVQTLEGGDLGRTVQCITGYEKDALNILQTKQGDVKRYTCAWTAAGEGAQQICRAVILDDGAFHHTLTVMADYREAGALAEQWRHLLSSAHLVSTG